MVLAAALHALAFYLLAVGLDRLPVPPAVVEPALQVYLYDRPRAPQLASRVAAIRPEKLVPELHWAEAPVLEISLPAQAPAPKPASPPAAASASGSSSARGRADSTPGESDALEVSHRVEPVYPPGSSRAHEQGTTVLDVLIDKRGRPQKVKVARSSGFQRLDDAALHAIRQWTFGPATDPAHGEWVQVQVGFHLHSLDQDVRMAGIHMTLLPFDPAVAGEFNALVPRVAGSPPKPGVEYRLRGLIEKLCALYSDRNFPVATRGVKSPMQVLAGNGALRQVRFLGLAPHALNVDDYRHLDEVRWDLYRAVQERGSSSWLVGVGADGMIKSVQMMADR